MDKERQMAKPPTFVAETVRILPPVIIGEPQQCMRCGKDLNLGAFESEVCWKCDREMIMEAEAEEHRQDMIWYELHGE